MCGRFVLLNDPYLAAFWQEMDELFGDHYNIAPSHRVRIAVHAENIPMLPASATWGFTSAYRPGLTINARAETIIEKPMFQQALQRRRCLVPAHGWYEWQTQGSRKQPQYIHRQDRSFLTFAGILQPGPAGQPPNLAIITTAATPALSHIHDRMPAIIPQSRWAQWLHPKTPTPDLQTLLTPFTDPVIIAHPVSGNVGNPRANDPSLIQPVTPPQPERGLFD